MSGKTVKDDESVILNNNDNGNNNLSNSIAKCDNMFISIGSIKNNSKKTFQINKTISEEKTECVSEWPKDTRLEFEKEICWKRTYDTFFVRENKCSLTDRIIDVNTIYYDILRSLDDFMYNWMGIWRRSCLLCGKPIIINNYGYCSLCFLKSILKKKLTRNIKKLSA